MGSKSSLENMDAGGSSGPASKNEASLAKKRARDRRAQQNQRNKRNEQVRSLQDQLARMESRMLQLGRECEGLRRENRRLHARQDAVGQLVASWGAEGTPSSSSGGDSGGRDDVEGEEDKEEGKEEESTSAEGGGTIAPPEVLSHRSGQDNHHNHHHHHHTSPAAAMPTAPWNDLPAHSPSDVVVTEAFRAWLQRPDLARASPDQPQPTELLYGSRTNFLANVIHRALRSWPCRDPERLAAGWLVYHQIRWMLRPSPSSYARLQAFQAPVPEQQRAPGGGGGGHAHFVDFVPWPALRARLVRLGGAYDPRDVLGMFLCCVKLRWPWGRNFLEPGEDGTLRMRREFLDTFTSLDGWGLTDEFIQTFPLLTEGLDLSAIRYRVC